MQVHKKLNKKKKQHLTETLQSSLIQQRNLAGQKDAKLSWCKKYPLEQNDFQHLAIKFSGTQQAVRL